MYLLLVPSFSPRPEWLFSTRGTSIPYRVSQPAAHRTSLLSNASTSRRISPLRITIPSSFTSRYLSSLSQGRGRRARRVERDRRCVRPTQRTRGGFRRFAGADHECLDMTLHGSKDEERGYPRSPHTSLAGSKSQAHEHPERARRNRTRRVPAPAIEHEVGLLERSPRIEPGSAFRIRLPQTASDDLRASDGTSRRPEHRKR